MKPTKEVLQNMYQTQRISPESIGKEFGVSGRTIRTWLNDYEIPRLGAGHLRKGKTAVWNVGVTRTAEQIEKNRQAHIGRTPYNKGWGDVTFTCEVCGKTVTAKVHEKKRTCSKECKNKLSHINRGDKHWNYKGEDTPSKQRQRLWAQAQEWRAAVLKRANYACQKCSRQSKKLIGHHIYAWAEYPDKRFDIDNGACLCKSCHSLFHKLYGTRRSLHVEFYLWLNSN